MSTTKTIERSVAGVAIAIMVLAPLLFSASTVDQLLTQVLILDIVPVRLIFFCRSSTP